MNATYVAVENIIGKIKRDYNIQEPEYILLLWAAEALDHIKVPKMLQPVVKVIEISDYKGLLPDDIVFINQFAKYLKSPRKQSLCSILNSVTEAVEPAPESVHNPCCESSSEENPEINSCLQQFVMSGCTLPRSGNSLLSPLRKTTNNFFDTHKCDGTMPCVNEYRLGNGIIETSFKSGYVLISYLRFYRDESSTLLIPDDVSVKEAITRYVIYKHTEKKLYTYDKYSDFRVAANKVAKAQADWHWYARQAKNKMMALDIDDYQNMLEHSHEKVHIKDYYEYFSTLNRSNGY